MWSIIKVRSIKSTKSSLNLSQFLELLIDQIERSDLGEFRNGDTCSPRLNTTRLIIIENN